MADYGYIAVTGGRARPVEPQQAMARSIQTRTPINSRVPQGSATAFANPVLSTGIGRGAFVGLTTARTLSGTTTVNGTGVPRRVVIIEENTLAQIAAFTSGSDGSWSIGVNTSGPYTIVVLPANTHTDNANVCAGVSA